MSKKPLSAEKKQECLQLKAIFESKKRELGLTQEKLAHALDMNQSSVSHYLNGVNPLNASVAASFAKILGTEVSAFSPRLAEEIARIADSVSKPKPEPFDANVEPAFRPSRKSSTYPVISWIAAGSRSQSPEHYVPGSGLAFESDQNAGEYGYWLEVKGGSMTSTTTPSFLPGTYVLVQPEGFDLVSGKYYIAQHRDGETTFKQYVYDAGREYLVPLNPAFETIKMDDDWDVIGRVIDVKITGL